jgi:hypothetical protein
VATKPVAFEWSSRGTPKNPNNVYAANSATRMAMRMSRARVNFRDIAMQKLDLIFAGAWMGLSTYTVRCSDTCW